MMTQMDMRRLHHTLFSYDRSAAKPLPFAATPWPIHYLKHEQNLTLRLGSRKEHFHIHNVGAQKHFKANVTAAQEKSLAPQTLSKVGSVKCGGAQGRGWRADHVRRPEVCRQYLTMPQSWCAPFSSQTMSQN